MLSKGSVNINTITEFIHFAWNHPFSISAPIQVSWTSQSLSLAPSERNWLKNYTCALGLMPKSIHIMCMRVYVADTAHS